jgi:hypothetical protein
MKITAIKTCHPDSTSGCAHGKTIIIQVGYCAISLEFEKELSTEMIEAMNFHLSLNDKEITIIQDSVPAKEEFNEYKNSF